MPGERPHGFAFAESIGGFRGSALTIKRGLLAQGVRTPSWWANSYDRRILIIRSRIDPRPPGGRTSASWPPLSVSPHGGRRRRGAMGPQSRRGLPPGAQDAEEFGAEEFALAALRRRACDVV